jgi:transposase
LFYSFNLEDHIPQNHLLRGIDRCLEFAGLREHLTEHYSQIGRPSIDPELMLRMLVVGYCYGIRSERRLCDALHLNLAYRWFCRLSLEDAVPDHSTFSKNRHGRFRDSGVFRCCSMRSCVAAWQPASSRPRALLLMRASWRPMPAASAVPPAPNPLIGKIRRRARVP